jgi:LmbE family N-acetylglucosaminyl deacetylase
MTDLLLIVPHPDDEVFGCGGLFTKMAAQGKRVATLTMTRGGAGRTLDVCTREQLREVREAELRAALRVLGVEEVHIWDYPDFVPAADRGMPDNEGLRGIPEDEIVPRIRALLEHLAPRVVITFPPNGSNGHPDHVVTHTLAMRAMAEARHEVERLYYFASERPYAGEVPRGFLPAERIREGHLAPTHYIEVGSTIENKLRAMGHHETQARSVLMFMRRFPRRLLVESFHRASPAYPVGEGPMTVEWL